MRPTGGYGDAVGGRPRRRGLRPAVALVVVTLGVLGAGCHSQTVGAGAFGEATDPVPTVPDTTVASTGPPGPTSPGGAPLAPIPQPFAGRWTGQAYRPNTQTPVRNLAVTLPLNGTRGTFAIAGYCTGVISVLSTTATRLLGQEEVSADPNSRCGSGGFFTLDLTAPGRAVLSWNDPSQADQVAPGVLTRS